MQAGIAKRQTASSYLKKLTEIGVLEEHKAGREVWFVHPKFFTLLTQEENTFNLYQPPRTKA